KRAKVLFLSQGSSNYLCNGSGGDFSLPGADFQPLHSDLVHESADFWDPWQQGNLRLLPPPWICINVLMVDFTVQNGATRQIPGTQRSLCLPPGLGFEPEWMKSSHVCAPAGSALVRDIRCWHGGTPNLLPLPPPSDLIGVQHLGEDAGYARPMLNVEFTAPWFRIPHRDYKMIPRNWWDKMSIRGKELTRNIVLDTDQDPEDWNLTFGKAWLEHLGGAQVGKAVTG
ncbi:hypothetical protein CYMTET_30590, partial [Cymbomonas tetramitiformis]